jgi:HK97 family phage prohead protease
MRADGTQGSKTLQVLGGYALKYNKMSQNLGGFVERVAPGALNKTLADGGDVLARFQHEDSYLLGRTSAGTLRLASDDTGLDYSVDLPDTSYAHDLAALAERGDVRHSSFAFRVLPDGDDWSVTESDFPLRTITEIQLLDVAPVVNPAYMDTSSGLRSLAEHLSRPEEEIAEAIRANKLAELIKKPPTVIDIKSSDSMSTTIRVDGDKLAEFLARQASETPEVKEPETAPVTEPGDTHSIATAARKRRLELLRLRNTL